MSLFWPFAVILFILIKVQDASRVDLIVVRENTECLVRFHPPALLFYSNAAAKYVKEENLIQTEKGKEARATRLITERASSRIGRIGFELAKARPRKVVVPESSLLVHSMSYFSC